MTTIKVNSNFHTLSGTSAAPESPAYREYRRWWREYPEQGIVSDFPLFLDLEVTSICNLQCPFCATTYRGKLIPRGSMTETLFRKLIDEGAAHGLYGVKLNYRGEPLLHPAIDRFVAYAKQRGLIDVYFNTNALLLDESMAERLIDAGLDRISVSFEGTTREVYERNRVGSSHERVLANLAGLQELKRRRGVSHPRLRVQTVKLPEIDLEEYRRFWTERADEVAYLDYKEMKERRQGVVDPWVCPQLWQRLGVMYDGTIIPCNHDDDALLKLGDANRDRLRDCWHSAALTELRRRHRAGEAHLLPGCDGCYLRDSEIRKSREEDKR